MKEFFSALPQAILLGAVTVFGPLLAGFVHWSDKLRLKLQLAGKKTNW